MCSSETPALAAAGEVEWSIGMPPPATAESKGGGTAGGGNESSAASGSSDAERLGGDGEESSETAGDLFLGLLDLVLCFIWM